MSYDEAFDAAWESGGYEAALQLLRGIFHDPNNQKIQGQPTDYLNDEDDDQVEHDAGRRAATVDGRHSRSGE